MLGQSMFLLRYPNISTTQMEQHGPEVPLNQYDSNGAISKVSEEEEDDVHRPF